MDEKCNFKYKKYKDQWLQTPKSGWRYVRETSQLFCLVVAVREKFSTCESTLGIVEGLVSREKIVVLYQLEHKQYHA